MPDCHCLTDKEVNLSARLLVAEYKSRAVHRAEQRIAEMKVAGERTGAFAWARIREAAQELVSDGLRRS